HGLGYSFFYIVAILYVDRMAPPEARAGAQGLITFASLGVGFLAGTLFAAWVVGCYSHAGVTDWPHVWAVPFVGSLVVAVVFVLMLRAPPESKEKSLPSDCR